MCPIYFPRSARPQEPVLGDRMTDSMSESPEQALRNRAGELIDPRVDYAGIARRAVLGGAAAGAAVLLLTLWRIRRLLADAPASDQPVLQGGMYERLVLGLFAAAILAAGIAWVRLAVLPSPLRRMGLSLSAALGVIVAALVAVPLNHALGPDALAVGALAAAGGAVWLLRPRPAPAA